MIVRNQRLIIVPRGSLYEGFGWQELQRRLYRYTCDGFSSTIQAFGAGRWTVSMNRKWNG